MRAADEDRDVLQDRENAHSALEKRLKNYHHGVSMALTCRRGGVTRLSLCSSTEFSPGLRVQLRTF